VIKSMAETGNPNSVSDAGVGALAIRVAVEGAYMNVLINASAVKETPDAKILLEKGRTIMDKTQQVCGKIVEKVFESLKLFD